MDASKTRDEFERQLNQRSEACIKLSKDLDEATKSVEKERNDAKLKLESIIKEKEESLKKIKEEGESKAAKSSEEITQMKKEMEVKGMDPSQSSLSYLLDRVHISSWLCLHN